MRIIAQNKKAFHDYTVLDRLEAGIVLTGDEVKSLREGRVSLDGAYITPHQGELYLINCYIKPYSKAFQKREEQASRARKLLVHKRELDRLIGKVAQKGITMIPLKLYFSDRGRVKVDMGLCKHKKAHQRKEELKERAIRRETARELKQYK